MDVPPGLGLVGARFGPHPHTIFAGWRARRIRPEAAPV
ncbi:hypothetical protein ABH935_003891 [Catenulispora sp. GAS73]